MSQPDRQHLQEAAPSADLVSTRFAQLALQLRRLLRWSLLLFLLALPFETVRGLRLPGLQLTNVELLLFATLLLWGLSLLFEWRLPQLPRGFVLAGAAFVGLLLLSALLAPAFGADALKFALRQLQGLLLACLLADIALRERFAWLRWPLLALLTGAALSALLGLWEISESPLAIAWLSIFKSELTMMGGLLRLSASFTYANIAAMYFEALLPLAYALALAVIALRWRWLAFLLVLLLFAATMLTYSRAALFSSLVIVCGMPLLVFWRWGRTRQTRDAVLLSGTLLVLTLGAALLNPTFRLRMLEPDVRAWYAVDYRADPLPQLRTGEEVQLKLQLSNTGRAAWRHDGLRPFRLSYHWLRAGSREVVEFEGVRTDLPRSILPGEQVEVLARLRAPAEPGEYLLAWDLVQEHGIWMSQAGLPMLEQPVQVAGPVLSRPSEPAPAAADAALQGATESGIYQGPPGRLALWTAALQLWMTRPLLGIGPDVFRHVYGPVLGLQVWDQRIHTNNLYLEILTGAGLLGLIAFGLMLASLLLPAWRQLPRRDGLQWWLTLSMAAGILAYLVHGLLDVFLAFTPTGLLFWTCLGLLAGMLATNERVSGERLFQG